jgi:glycosyltransferase involved in cell wall biosynthesis
MTVPTLIDPAAIALISVHGDPAAEIGQEGAGGQNVYVRHVGEALADLGWEVDMLTRHAHPEDPAIVEHGPRCRTVRLTAGPQKFIPRDQLFDWLPEFVQAVEQHQTQCPRRYALLHTNYWLSSWVGMQLAPRWGVPQVHTYHSIGAVKYDTMAHRPPIADIRLATERRCLETVDRVVATSPQEAADMRSLISPHGQITTIPCGTDVERFGQVDRATARQRLGLVADALILFYVGRFDVRKGIEVLVEAIGLSRFRQDPRFQVIIGGGVRPGHQDSEERDRIIARIAELGLSQHVQLPGRIGDADLPLYYAAASVCTVPSYYEPFGLVALEAMASATPVVASRVGGLKFSVADGETGLLVPPRDPAALAAASDRLLADPDWGDRLGQAARHRVETQFSWQRVAQQLDPLYRSLIATRSAVS